MSKINKQSTLILVGGLGNQLFQYFYTCWLLKDKSFSINVNLGDPRLNEHGQPDIFSFRIDNLQVTSSNNAFLLFKKWSAKFLLVLSSHGKSDFKGKVLFSFVEFLNLCYSCFGEYDSFIHIADGVGYFENKTNIGAPKYIIGNFHSFKWVSALGSEFVQRCLILRDDSLWLNSIRGEFLQNDPVVVHVRRGDYLGISNLGHLSVSYYFDLMREKQNNNEEVSFMVFSDDPETIREVLPSELASITKIVCANEEGSAINLLAMSLGKNFILSNSTFGWWAAFIAGFDETSVIAPRKWFSVGNNPKDIYPPSWKLSG
jgi:hypothetical protein